MARRKRKSWGEMSSGQRTAVVAGAAVQITLAATAWIDLYRRPPELVRGPKLAWAGVIAVNFVGPVTYFVAGRRRGVSAASPAAAAA